MKMLDNYLVVCPESHRLIFVGQSRLPAADMAKASHPKHPVTNEPIIVSINASQPTKSISVSFGVPPSTRLDDTKGSPKDGI